MDYKFPREYMHKFWWKLLGSGISETPFGILLLQSRAFWLISSSHDRMANFLSSTSEVSWGAKWYTRTKSWQVGRSNAMLRIHYWYSMAFPNWPRVYNTTEVFATAPFFWQLLFSAWTASVYTVQFKGLPIWCWTHLLPCNIRTTNMVHALIPAITFKNGFTTSQDMKRDNRIVVVALSDSTLGVHKIYSKTSHNLVVPPKPSGSSALPPPTKHGRHFTQRAALILVALILGGLVSISQAQLLSQSNYKMVQRKLLWAIVWCFRRSGSGSKVERCPDGVSIWSRSPRIF